ncbi:hypothetical protein PhCBS80983_g04500 [Powellomyces hirtus]|uniref:Vacuole protein n=1 Tax=Powellomyces hirtus TaxID=109895 RepID=A0A507E0B2_9FUNG|nr:hypothetical protein PhCBS80983_g04500 [Powellomyces hirtus]
MSCCGAAKWKREHIEDHKFDLIDVDDFTDRSFLAQIRYSWVFFITLKSVLVYMADLGVVLLLVYNAITIGAPCVSASAFSSTDTGSLSQEQRVADTCADSGFLGINGKWRFGLTLATITLSYILLALEWKKGLAIVRSKDISYAFTNTVAYRYYVIRSYGHFCLFSTIEATRKLIDELAFWVFFTFRGWKRLLLAELPRQFLNFMLLHQSYKSIMEEPGSTKSGRFCERDGNGRLIGDISKPPNIKNEIPCVYQKELGFIPTFMWLMFQQTETMAKVGTWLASITVAMWSISAILLILAFIVYIPLLFKIRGNLKEYCCHKVDKRINEVLKKKSRKRAEQARKREQKEIAKYGKLNGPAPTLPDVDLHEMSSNPPYSTDSSSAQLLGGKADNAVLYGAGHAYYAHSGPGSSYAESVGTGSAYGGHARGQPSPLPPMPNPYARAVANYGHDGHMASPYEHDMQSEYGGSHAPTQYSGAAYPHHPHPQQYQMHQHPGRHPGYVNMQAAPPMSAVPVSNGSQHPDDQGYYGDDKHQELSTNQPQGGYGSEHGGSGKGAYNQYRSESPRNDGYSAQDATSRVPGGPQQQVYYYDHQHQPDRQGAYRGSVISDYGGIVSNYGDGSSYNTPRGGGHMRPRQD